jgi:hypothetical protein
VISALYVQTDGAYYGLKGVDPWDEVRDARLYAGPHPVVAHPPCSTWCMLASVNEARWGKMIGDDGGTFAAALAAVRQYGGVLEHPAYWRGTCSSSTVPPAATGRAHFWMRDGSPRSASPPTAIPRGNEHGCTTSERTSPQPWTGGTLTAKESSVQEFIQGSPPDDPGSTGTPQVPRRTRSGTP